MPKFHDPLLIDAATPPANPAAGVVVVYVDSTSGNVTQKDSAGVVTDLAVAGAAAPPSYQRLMLMMGA